RCFARATSAHQALTVGAARTELACTAGHAASPAIGVAFGAVLDHVAASGRLALLWTARAHAALTIGSHRARLVRRALCARSTAVDVRFSAVLCIVRTARRLAKPRVAHLVD